MKGLTYKGTGVDYSAMDPFKLRCQLAGLQTAGNIRDVNGGEFQEFEPSRGESCYLIETPWGFLAHVEEGLGTKNLVADVMSQITGRTYYGQIAQDTVAMIVNDMATAGARPLSVAMHLAVGSSDWFEDEARMRDLVRGWKEACDLSGCVWGGGETPTLRDIILPKAVVLAGSAMGVVMPKDRRLDGSKIQTTDSIILVRSSGIHANGLTLARKIATKLPDGYASKLSDGRMYGEALLDPTVIYVRLVEAILEAKLRLHYAVNITGHGWRKLMRAPGNFTYTLRRIPEPQPVFEFMQKHGPVTDEEAYGNLNMGAGFALYVDVDDTSKTLAIAKSLGYDAWCAGNIMEGEKKVVITPVNLEFKASTLAVR